MEDRAAYVRQLAGAVISADWAQGGLDTVYFGGGSPALCELTPFLQALRPYLADDAEFTVELHPHDVADDLLKNLRDRGVSRISMGVQSLDDAVLAHMGRGYTHHEAAQAFARVRKVFDNAGIDLIVGYPGEAANWNAQMKELSTWGLRHCSVYALQNERGLANVPDDDTTLDRLHEVADHLQAMGLCRYEISNYAGPGYECRHNRAVWRGEDYVGLGAGAYGRVGLQRTRNWGLPAAGLWKQIPERETISEEQDAKERRIFRLRTNEGLDAHGFEEWRKPLAEFVREGLLTRADEVYHLTARGMEVCDTILAELV